MLAVRGRDTDNVRPAWIRNQGLVTFVRSADAVRLWQRRGIARRTPGNGDRALVGMRMHGAHEIARAISRRARARPELRIAPPRKR